MSNLHLLLPLWHLAYSYAKAAHDNFSAQVLALSLQMLDGKLKLQKFNLQKASLSELCLLSMWCL